MAKPLFNSKLRVGPKPDGKVRQSQLVTTFGPGAMMDLLHDAALVSGLDQWRFDPVRGAVAIDEPRLRDRIAEKFGRKGPALRVSKAFLLPPAGNDRDEKREVGIPVLEFPRWFVCQNPECRALVGASALQVEKGQRVHDCGRTKSPCTPMRFVAACRKGHMEDFPWLHFVHERRSQRCTSPTLAFHEGQSFDFAEVRVVCDTCGAERRLIEASIEQANPFCQGKRPWLGEGSDEPCNQHMRLLVRTASNSYFALTESALSIPDVGMKCYDAVKSQWSVLKTATPATLGVFRTIEDVAAAIGEFSDADVLAAKDAIAAGQTPRRDLPRTAEYKQMLAAPSEVVGQSIDSKELFVASTIPLPAGLPRQIKQVVLAPRLREVRAQVGFTRIEAPSADLQGEYQVESAPLGLNTDWLPAIEVKGEGFFVALDEDAVRSWETWPNVVERTAELRRGYEAWAKTRSGAPPFPGARYYLVHSLAHLMIAAVSLECGYAASAIRERIYCAPAGDATPMAAFLLATGTVGAEGTLGGLVEQGRNLARHFARAFDLGVLCSNDPVCAAHSPDRDPTERFREGAACHGCLFVAECSCERFNQDLDRALVVPTLGREGVAFFDAAAWR